MNTYTEEEIAEAIANGIELPDTIQWNRDWECCVNVNDLATYYSDINDEPY